MHCNQEREVCSCLIYYPWCEWVIEFVTSRLPWKPLLLDYVSWIFTLGEEADGVIEVVCVHSEVWAETEKQLSIKHVIYVGKSESKVPYFIAIK